MAENKTDRAGQGNQGDQKQSNKDLNQNQKGSQKKQQNDTATMEGDESVDNDSLGTQMPGRETRTPVAGQGEASQSQNQKSKSNSASEKTTGRALRTPEMEEENRELEEEEKANAQKGKKEPVGSSK